MKIRAFLAALAVLWAAPAIAATSDNSAGLTYLGGTTYPAKSVGARLAQDLWATDPAFGVDPANADNSAGLTAVINYAKGMTNGATIHLPCGVLKTSTVLPNINVSNVSLVSACGSWGRPKITGLLATAYVFGTTIQYTGSSTSSPILTISPDDNPTTGTFQTNNSILGVMFDCNALAAECLRIKSVWYSTWMVGFNDPTSIGIHFDTANLNTANNVQWNTIQISGRTLPSSPTTGVFVDGTGCVNGDCTTAPGDFSGNIILSSYIVCDQGTAWKWGFSDHNYAIRMAGQKYTGGSTCTNMEFLGSHVASDPNGVKPARYNVIHMVSGGVGGGIKSDGAASGYDFPAHDNMIEDCNVACNSTPTIDAGSTFYWGWDRQTQVAGIIQGLMATATIGGARQEQQFYWDEYPSNWALSLKSTGNKQLRIHNGDEVLLPFADTTGVADSDTVTDSLGCVPGGTTVSAHTSTSVTLSAGLSVSGACLTGPLKAGADTFTFHGSLALTTNADLYPTEYQITLANSGTDRHLTIAPANVPTGYAQGLNLGAGTSFSTVANGQLSIGCAPTSDGSSGHGSVLTLCSRSGDPTTAPPASGNYQIYTNSSSGTIRIQDTSNNIWNLAGTSLAETNNYTVLASDNGRTFSNVGATGEVDFTLPAAANGLAYCFGVDAAQTFKIITHTGDKIYVGGTATAASGNVVASAIGATLCLRANTTGQWLTTSTADKTQWTVN